MKRRTLSQSIFQWRARGCLFIALAIHCTPSFSMNTPNETIRLSGQMIAVTNTVAGYQAWVPADVPVIRGVIVGSMGANWDYRHFVQRPAWQAAARHWGFALIGTAESKKAAIKQGKVVVGDDLLRALEHIGRASGHAELTNAAVCSFGFSEGAAYSMMLGSAIPDRVVAIGGGGSAPSWLGATNATAEAVRNIPIFLTQGDEDNLAGHEWFKELAAVRELGFRIGLAGLWGLSHFDGNYENLMLIHFDTAIRERLDSEWNPRAAPPRLRVIPFEQGWLGDLRGCEKWSTMAATIKPWGEVDDAMRNQCGWFVNETMARAWQAYAPRQNAVMLREPFCDAVDYIASRELLPPQPAGESIRLKAVSYWFHNITSVEFFAGTNRLARIEVPADGPVPKSFEAVWEKPEPGVYAVYALFTSSRGQRSTKPCPVVVTRIQPER